MSIHIYSQNCSIQVQPSVVGKQQTLEGHRICTIQTVQSPNNEKIVQFSTEIKLSVETHFVFTCQHLMIFIFCLPFFKFS